MSKEPDASVPGAERPVRWWSVALFFSIGTLSLWSWWQGLEHHSSHDMPRVSTPALDPLGYRFATYTIENIPVTLHDGVSIQPMLHSESMMTTRYFGNPATLDVNADGIMDHVFVMTQDQGGSGTFYYAALALGTPSGWQGTTAYFLGDRIAPQSTTSEGPEVLFHVAVRAEGEPFSVPPHIGVTHRMRYDPTVPGLVPHLRD